MKSLTASDRKSLIRLASSLPKGDKSRRSILNGLKSASFRTAYMGIPKALRTNPGETPLERMERILRDYPGRKRTQIFQKIVEEARPKYGPNDSDYMDGDVGDLEYDMFIVQDTPPGEWGRRPDPKKSDEYLLERIKTERARR